MVEAWMSTVLGNDRQQHRTADAVAALGPLALRAGNERVGNDRGTQAGCLGRRPYHRSGRHHAAERVVVEEARDAEDFIMAPTRIERGLADDIRGNIGGERGGVSAAGEKVAADVGVIDQEAADIAAARHRAGAGVNEFGGVLHRETEGCPGPEILDNAQLPIARAALFCR
jgi:hypothetical protein